MRFVVLAFGAKSFRTAADFHPFAVSHAVSERIQQIPIRLDRMNMF
jgi:hypothetical protein